MEENRNITAIIRDMVDQTLNEQDLMKKIIKGDISELTKELYQSVEQWPTFGDYLYRYIFEVMRKLDDTHPDYQSVPESDYYAIIKDSFAQNGLKGRGSLDPAKKSVRLDRKRELFTQPAYRVSREDAFLFAFGLHMEAEDVSVFLQDALLQCDFNPKNPKEAIYYWCLKNGDSYEKLLEWMNWYNQLEDPQSVMTVQKTRMMMHTLDNLKTERDVKQYLQSLKKAEQTSGNAAQALSRKTPIQEYERLVREMPRINQEYKERINLKEEAKSDEAYMESGIQKLAEDIEIYRATAYQQNKNKDILPEPHIAVRLFQDVVLTPKSIRNRLSGAVEISRTDLLVLLFLNYTIGLEEEEQDALAPKAYDSLQVTVPWLKKEAEASKACNVPATKRKSSFLDLEQEINLVMDLCGMDAMYVRNPFELFLVICMLHTDPFGYFMSTWELAVQHTTRK